MKVRPLALEARCRDERGGIMTTHGEAKQIILEMVEKIKNEYRPNSIILFGSYAYGTPDRDSDIDLLVIKETQDRPIDRRVHVAGIISDPKQLIPLETIVLTPDEVAQRIAIGDQFIEEILEKGEALYEA